MKTTFKHYFFNVIALMMVLMLLPMRAMADSDVSAELRQQNTPSGWTAVQLPNIVAITSENTFNITSYGASTGSADNASAINQAISAANAAGGGMVVIPSGTWLSGPITMKSKVVLHISKNCTLKVLPFKGLNQNVSAGESYYPVTGWTSTTKDGKTTWSATLANFISNGGATVDDIIIEGEGVTSVIDGQGEPWWKLREEIGDYTRPNLIRIEKGARHLFRNFKALNSMSQNIVLGRSGNANNITVHGITIDNPSSEASTPSHNTDGFPIWGPYVNIYDCNISTGDDNIVCDSKAHHIHAWNITCGDGHGMSIGSYTSELHDVIYEGITFNGTGSGFRIKTNNDRSGNDLTGSNGAVKNIICRNATMTGCPSPIKITSWYDKDIDTPASNPTAAVSATTPEFCNILFQNITATAVSGKTSWKHNRPIYLYGRPEMYIHDVTFDNVKINSVLGMFMAFSKNVTFKNGCKITNEKNSGSLLTTEHLAYSDNGSTLLSANASKYNGSESATTYSVTFKNGSATYKTYNICPNSYAYPPADPTKSGATFLGWATSEGGTPVVLAQTQLAKGGTFYAVWDGEGDGEGENESESLTTPANDKEEVSGNSYTTTGQMMTNQKSGDYIKIRTGNNGNTWTFNVADGYTITGFHVEGWSNNSTSTATITATSIKADGVEVLNANKVFQPNSNNKTKIDLTGISAKNTLVVTFDNSNINSETGSKNKQLYAKVSFDYSTTSSTPSGGENDVKTYSVSFYDGDTQYGESQQIEAGQTVAAPSPAPTKDGYSLQGWSETNGGTVAVTFPYTVESDKAFYAIWEEVEEPTYSNFSMTVPSTAPTAIGDMVVAGGSISDNNSTTKALTFDKNGVKFGGSACQLKITLTDNIVAGTTISVTYKNTSSDKTTGLGVFDKDGSNAVINLSNNIAISGSGTASYTFTDANTTYIGNNELIITRNGGSGGLAISEITVTFPLTFSEDRDYTSFVEGTYTVTLKKTFPAGKWTSLVLPFGATTVQLMEAFPDNAEGTEIAVVKEMRDNTVYFTTRASIEANVPVLIKVDEPNADNVYTFKGVTVVNAADSPNSAMTGGIQMCGLYKKTGYNDDPISSDRQHMYFVSQSKFYDWSYLSSMPPFSAYIYAVSASSGTKPIMFMLGDDATGVVTVEGSYGEAVKEYNVLGQRIGKKANGMHIRNGKKYFVK